MEKEEVLQKSREENAAAFLDEREKVLRLREDSFALGIGLALVILLGGVKLYRGQPILDLLTLVMGMSAAGFIYRAGKEKKRTDKIMAVLCTLLAVLYFVRFLLGGP